jgi:hypothetical protein
MTGPPYPSPAWFAKHFYTPVVVTSFSMSPSLAKRSAKLFLDATCSINSLINPCTYVRYLSVSEGHDDLHLNETLPLIVPRVSNLTMLKLVCLVWDDAAWATVLSGFPQVKYLKLEHCKFKTSEELNDLIASFPSLTYINCWDTLWQSYTEPVTPLPRSLTSVTLPPTQLKFFDRLLNLESHPNVPAICLQGIVPEDILGTDQLLKTLGLHLEHLNIVMMNPELGINAKGQLNFIVLAVCLTDFLA